MDEKKYLLNEVPISARGLIDAAKAIDDSYYGKDGILLTSEAARILRADGQTISNNPAWSKDE